METLGGNVDGGRGILRPPGDQRGDTVTTGIERQQLMIPFHAHAVVFESFLESRFQQELWQCEDVGVCAPDGRKIDLGDAVFMMDGDAAQGLPTLDEGRRHAKLVHQSQAVRVQGQGVAAQGGAPVLVQDADRHATFGQAKRGEHSDRSCAENEDFRFLGCFHRGYCDKGEGGVKRGLGVGWSSRGKSGRIPEGLPPDPPQPTQVKSRGEFPLAWVSWGIF